MKLKTLLEQHRAHAQSPALAACFGDGYLATNNSVYRAIRKSALTAGAGFSRDQNDAYRSLSLSQLDTILKTKIIPYVDNVSVLEEIEKKIPNQTVWNDISDNLKGNSVFHESCHFVARAILGDSGYRGGGEVASRTLAMLLEESFANTCELLSIVDAKDQVHRIFIELNSYVYMLDDRASLVNAADEIGRKEVVTFLMLSYLHANFLRELSEKDFERSCRIAVGGRVLDPKQKKTLRALSKIAFKLNPRFREVTTRFYMKLNGISTDVTSLTGFDFLSVLEANSPESKFLTSAAATLS